MNRGTVEEFPSNSVRKKTADEYVDDIRSAQGKTKKPEEGKVEDKKIERVTNGEVVRRKKTLGKRFTETLFGGADAKSVFSYITLDVMVPAAKDTIADMTSLGMEKLLFGETRSSSRRRGGYSGPNGRVNYNQISSNNRPPWDRKDPRRDVSRRGRASHDFDEIILETRGEAEEVIDRLFDLISRYEVASVADLYELTGITGNYTDNKWGWTDIRGAGVSRVRNGYLLDLPRPEPID